MTKTHPHRRNAEVPFADHSNHHEEYSEEEDDRSDGELDQYSNYDGGKLL